MAAEKTPKARLTLAALHSLPTKRTTRAAKPVTFPLFQRLPLTFPVLHSLPTKVRKQTLMMLQTHCRKTKTKFFLYVVWVLDCLTTGKQERELFASVDFGDVGGHRLMQPFVRLFGLGV